jgi:hypothetical protein
MDNDASVSGGYKPPHVFEVLSIMTSNSFAATNGEVEPEYSDAFSFCAVGGAVDDTGSIRSGGSGVGTEDYLLSLTACLSNNDNCLVDM